MLIYRNKIPTFKVTLSEFELYYSIPGIFEKGVTIEDAEAIIRKLIFSKLITYQLIKDELTCQTKN